MDKDTKLKIAKALVMVDDSIATSGGLADFLGKMLAKGFGLLVGADLDGNTDGKSADFEQVEAK